ncbi:MAG: hypothetical protein ABR548_08205 [Actinomycetota bacterium]
MSKRFQIARGVLIGMLGALLMFAGLGCSSPAARMAGSAGAKDGIVAASGATTKRETGSTSSVTPKPAGSTRTLPNSTAAREKCYGMIMRFAGIPAPGTNYIDVVVDPGRSFGAQCPALESGRTCFIPLKGKWHVVGSIGGSIVVNLYENRSKVAAKRVLYRPLAASGQFNQSTYFQYTPPPKTTVVRMVSVLYNAAGVPVDQTPEQTLFIPACSPVLGHKK